MWTAWTTRDILANLTRCIAIVDSNTEIFPEEHHDKNRAAITSLATHPPSAAEIEDRSRQHDLAVIGFALDICGRRASQQGQTEEALDLLHASHELFRSINANFKPSKPMRQVVDNALRLLFRQGLQSVISGQCDADVLRTDLHSFVLSAWGELPPQLALSLDEMLLTGLENARAAHEDDTHFHERFVRENIETILKLDIPKRLEEIRRRWEEIGRHIAPSATRIAARSVQRPSELSDLISTEMWREIADTVERGDSLRLAHILSGAEDTLEGNLKLRLDAKAEYLEPTSELRLKNSPEPAFVEARELLLHQGAAALDKFRTLHYRRSTHSIAKEWYAYALARFGKRTDIHEIIGLLEDALTSEYYRQDVSWSARWNLACALRRIPDRADEALGVLLPLLDNDTHTSEVFELCLLWALELKNSNSRVLDDLLSKSTHYEAHLLAALHDLEELDEEDRPASFQVHFRRLNHILRNPNHVFPEPKERLGVDELDALTREFLEHSLLAAGIEWFRQRLSYGLERGLFKNWECMARLQEEAKDYRAAWRCREQQWRTTARNPRVFHGKKASVLRSMLTWGQRHSFHQQALALLKSGWRDANFTEGDLQLWEQRLTPPPITPAANQATPPKRVESEPGPVTQQLAVAQLDRTIQQLAGAFSTVSSIDQLTSKADEAEQLLDAVKQRHTSTPQGVFEAVRAVLRLAVDFGGTVSTTALQGRFEEFRGRLELLRDQRSLVPFELSGLSQAAERVMQNLAVKAQALPEIAITPPDGLHMVLGRPATGSWRSSRLLARLANQGPEVMTSIEVTFLSPSKGIRINPAPVTVPLLGPGVRTIIEAAIELESSVGESIEVRLLVSYQIGGLRHSSQAAGVLPIDNLSPLQTRYITLAPVTTDRMDLFHGRERELSDLHRAITSPRMVKLYFVNGIRAVGKSTLMHHLGARCSPEFLTILVPLESVLGKSNMTPLQLVRQLCRVSLREAQRSSEIRELELRVPEAEAFELDPPWVVFEDFLEALRQQTGRRILLCIDEMQFLIRRIADPIDPIDEGFLGWLRDKIQSGSELRVVCTGSESFGQLRKHHDHVVWRNMEPYDISFVDRSAMERIATIPVREDGVAWLPEALDRLWDYTEGHPCVIQILAERAVTLIDLEGRLVIGPADIDRAYDAVPHDIEIWELWWNEKEGMVSPTHLQIVFLILQNQPAARQGLEEMELADLAAKTGIRAVGRYLDEMRALEVLTPTRENDTRRWHVRGAFLERYLMDRLQRALQETAGGTSNIDATAPLAVMLDHENVKIGLLKVLQGMPGVEADTLRPRLEAANLATRLVDAAARFGVPRQRWAVADWDRPLFQGDQKAFKMARYSTDIAGHGDKNSSDHVLREKIHFVLREHPEIAVFVIGTGDADFHETIKTLQEQGRHVVLWSTREAINRVYGESLRGPDRIRIEWLEDIVFGDALSEPVYTEPRLPTPTQA